MLLNEARKLWGAEDAARLLLRAVLEPRLVLLVRDTQQRNTALITRLRVVGHRHLGRILEDVDDHVALVTAQFVALGRSGEIEDQHSTVAVVAPTNAQVGQRVLARGVHAVIAAAVPRHVTEGE